MTNIRKWLLPMFRKKAKPELQPEWLIVGLGNPGTEYAGTRHNVGFEVIELLARRHAIPVRKRALRSVLGDGVIEGQRVILARPMTYMNLSGEAVGAITRMYRIDPADVIE